MENPSNDNFYKMIHCSKPIADKFEKMQSQFKDSVKTIFKLENPLIAFQDETKLKPYLTNSPKDVVVKKLTTDAELETLSTSWKYNAVGFIRWFSGKEIKRLSETGRAFGLYYKEELVSWAVIYK